MKVNYIHFRFNFLLRGQLAKIIPCHEVFLVQCNLIFAILAQMLCGNHLNTKIIMSPNNIQTLSSIQVVKILENFLIRGNNVFFVLFNPLLPKESPFDK